MGSFSIPLSGLDADSTALNTIANNLANLNTTGFKSQTVELQRPVLPASRHRRLGRPDRGRRRDPGDLDRDRFLERQPDLDRQRQ